MTFPEAARNRLEQAIFALVEDRDFSGAIRVLEALRQTGQLRLVPLGLYAVCSAELGCFAQSRALLTHFVECCARLDAASPAGAAATSLRADIARRISSAEAAAAQQKLAQSARQVLEAR